MPVPPQSITSSSTPGATRTMRVLCGVVSTHPAGLKSAARGADGAASAISAATPSVKSCIDRFVIADIPLMNGF